VFGYDVRACGACSRYNVSTATALIATQPEISFPEEAKKIIFSENSRRALGPTKLHRSMKTKFEKCVILGYYNPGERSSQLLRGGSPISRTTLSFFPGGPGVERQGHEFDHSPRSSAQWDQFSSAWQLLGAPQNETNSIPNCR